MPAPSQILATLRRLGPAGVVAALAGVLPAVAGALILVNLPSLGRFLRDHAPGSAVLAAAAFVVVGGAMLAPTYSFAILCGWSFGPVLGPLTAVPAIALAALANYAWARRVMRDRVVKLLEEKPASRAVYNALLRASPLKTLLVVCLVRLPPNSPFAVTNVLLAATRVPVPTVLLGTVLGMLPRTVIVTLAAAHMRQLSAEQRNDPRLWILGLALTIGALALLAHLSKKALSAATTPPPSPDSPAPQPLLDPAPPKP